MAVVVLGLILIAILALVYLRKEKAISPDLSNPADRELTTRYNFAVKPEQEKPVKILKLYLYPMRGIMGIEVDALKVSKLGIKYDREWAIYETDKLGCITQSPEVKLTQLRQAFKKVGKQKYLVISVIDSHPVPEGIEREISIPIRKEVTGEVIDTGKVKGVAEGKEFDNWFSKFLGKNVILLRSAPGFKKGLPMNILKWGVDADQTKGFVSKAAIHVINEASTRDLSKRVLAQYSDPAERERIKITSIAFRPNIVIDTHFAYEEDRMQEARIGNTFFRIVGFCSRCKAVSSNYDTNDRNPELEPNPTLAKYRKHELGTLFGTYHQVEVIGNAEQFQRLLPEFPLPVDRKIDENYGIVRLADSLMVRVSEQRIEFDPAAQAK